jgi:hypothetical protein
MLTKEWKRMRMKKRFLMAVGLLSLVLGSQGARAATSQDYWDRPSESVQVSVGPGLAITGGTTGWALNFGALTRASESYPLYWGADVAFNFWGTSPSLVTPSTGATGIQLLPTIVYGFNVETLPSVFPYVGLSAGPNVYIEKVTVGSTTDTSTTVLFEVLFRVGANIAVTDALAINVEPKLGILRSDFIFLPQVALALSL